jgi:fibronectin type 3 domain-containing protein
VSLLWTASTSTIAGYNVYRGTQTGGPYAQVGTGNGTATTYTDSAVQSGQTYFYVVTAVDSAGHESVYSNEARAVVPSP